jgi:SAM-dependent methyltransferase
MSSHFYRAFEDRYRGSRELITHRLQAYLPFIEPLKSVYPDCKALDLGCGRGEWLELLQGMGIQAKGVDLDEGMLKACHEIGLQVEQGDALIYLADLPAESQTIVSAFHVVEHIDFDQLRLLVNEALRVLKPGGLLILETPNPENLLVATKNFYLDPSHQRPIPSELLSFVAEYAGFARVKTLGLQESAALISKIDISMQDVFSGASPDYAVIAQKQASPELIQNISSAFDQNYGLNMDQLLSRWDHRFDKAMGQAQAQAEQAQAQAEQAQVQAKQAQEQAEQARTYAQQVQAQAEQAQAEAHEKTVQLMAVYASRSWRITKPLRVVNQVRKGDLTPIRHAAQSTRAFLTRFMVLRRIYHFVKNPMGSVVRFVVERPRLKNTLRRIARAVPQLDRWAMQKRAEQQRLDFSRPWRGKYSSETDAPNLFARGYSHVDQTLGKRRVEDIVVLIRAELTQSKQAK